MAYKNFSRDGAYVFLVDNAAEEFGLALDHFTTNLILSRRQESPILVPGRLTQRQRTCSLLANMNVKYTIAHIRGNDILSFYKESVMGTEQMTYVPSFTRRHGIDLKDAFRSVTASVVERAQNIRVTLVDYQELLKTTKEFLQNNIVWYLEQPREISRFECPTGSHTNRQPGLAGSSMGDDVGD
ncbi:Terpenoid synthase [Venturia nashicola]|uniref:Terpenoid synthase n=1 Tax=Venturia nashicola TaxID=86259 RepID=A0A4Z1PFW8_9PEZI|nr:Terpenoid synthase [Venturia nashicola]TLD36743.1 Terpenoid synthase [Venturia nashicola]